MDCAAGRDWKCVVGESRRDSCAETGVLVTVMRVVVVEGKCRHCGNKKGSFFPFFRPLASLRAPLRRGSSSHSYMCVPCCTRCSPATCSMVPDHCTDRGAAYTLQEHYSCLLLRILRYWLFDVFNPLSSFFVLDSTGMPSGRFMPRSSENRHHPSAVAALFPRLSLCAHACVHVWYTPMAALSACVALSVSVGGSSQPFPDAVAFSLSSLCFSPPSFFSGWCLCVCGCRREVPRRSSVPLPQCFVSGLSSIASMMTRGRVTAEEAFVALSPV